MSGLRLSAFLAGSLLGLGLGMNTAAREQQPFTRMLVLGDSLSDTGNAGRFSNGPVWVEVLAERLGLPLGPSDQGGDNFAVGGAQLDPASGPRSLRAQAELLLKRPPASGRVLHVVYGGGNDLLGAVGGPDAASRVDGALKSLASILAELAGRGATDILVPNLPDIGMTPEMRSRGSRAVAEARALTERFNRGLDQVLGPLAGRADLRIHRLDVWALAELARTEPARFGFVDVTTPCRDMRPCEGSLFWDDVHPTTQAHARLADAALRAAVLPE